MMYKMFSPHFSVFMDGNSPSNFVPIIDCLDMTEGHGRDMKFCCRPKADLCCGDWLEVDGVYLLKCVKCVLKEGCAERFRQICVSRRFHVVNGYSGKEEIWER